MSISPVTPCFTPGTLIATDRGPIAVEALRTGDRLVTRDNGLRRVHWIGRRDVDYSELMVEPELAPVLVRAGAFGEGRPYRDMMVSPSHRFLIAPQQSFLTIEDDEALVAARHLMDGRMIRSAATLGVSYIHLLCDAHQVILADGVWTETFHPDDRIMRGLGNSQRREILDLFPEVETMGAANRFSAARTIVERP
ncbi:MAG: Hint domain-containing protein [Boseongicola sp.]|nr:Hint domain-containing protein [Boseongicola sp.]